MANSQKDPIKAETKDSSGFWHLAEVDVPMDLVPFLSNGFVSSEILLEYDNSHNCKDILQ